MRFGPGRISDSSVRPIGEVGVHSIPNPPSLNRIEVNSCAGCLLLILEVERRECCTESEGHDSTSLTLISLQIWIIQRLTYVQDAFYLCWKSRGGIVIPSPNRTDIESCADGLSVYTNCSHCVALLVRNVRTHTLHHLHHLISIIQSKFLENATCVLNGPPRIKQIKTDCANGRASTTSPTKIL